MANQGSGLGKGPDAPMSTPESTNPIDPRSGGAKRVQTSFPTTHGMRDRTSEVGPTAGVGGGGFTGAPDASSPNIMDPEPRKTLKRQPQILKTPFDSMDNLGPGRSSLDANAAGKVLGDAILSGSTALPSKATPGTASGSLPKPYPAKDPN